MSEVRFLNQLIHAELIDLTGIFDRDIIFGSHSFSNKFILVVDEDLQYQLIGIQIHEKGLKLSRDLKAVFESKLQHFPSKSVNFSLKKN